MRVADIGKNLTLINNQDDVDALLDALNKQIGLSLHGKACGCKAFYVLATSGTYHHVYGVRSPKPNATDPVHVHMEPAA